MFNTLIARLPDLVAVADRSGRLLQLNVSARWFFGDRPEGTMITDLLGADTAGDPRRRSALRRALRQRVDWSGPVEIVDDRDVPTPLHCLVVHDEEHTFLVLRENRDLRAREAAERAVLERDEFVARLGHEMRTPLNAMLGFAQLLELGPTDPSQLEAIERILTAGRHMQALLDDVLDLARVRAGGVDLDVGPVPVLDVVHGVLDLMEPLAEQRAIRCFVEPAGALVALADRRRLWQVLLNVVGNAVKYGREGGTVRVGVRPAGKEEPAAFVHLAVTDDGPGIEPSRLDQLFRPFSRLGKERTGVEGSGLGLAMSKALIVAMGGSLSATSRLGRGTTFTIELPALDLRELAPEPETSRPVIVFVTNDPAAEAMLTMALATRFEAKVVVVPRAAEALETVRKQIPAMVLIESELPDSTPVELLHRLDGDALTALIPKIALAFDADPRVRMRLRAAGASEVLALPLDVKRMLDIVGGILGRT